jgi:hypothetical protein
MKKIIVIMMIASLLCFSDSVISAERQLNRDEILSILQTLSEKPRKYWIASGVIEAIHSEYRAPKLENEEQIEALAEEELQAYIESPNKIERSRKLQEMKCNAIPFNVRYRLTNEYTMRSRHTIKVEGNKFHWLLSVLSREDSIRQRGGSCMSEHFNLHWNAERVFAWDGQKYTIYFISGNQAVIKEDPGNLPIAVNGPLTAGLVPWGYGKYQYDSLVTVDMTAVETEDSGQKEIQLTLHYPNESEIFLILDPNKNYAVIHQAIHEVNGKTTLQTCEDHRLIAKQWIPGHIEIENYKNTGSSSQLVARDVWDFISLDSEKEKTENFVVQFANDTLVEYYSSLVPEPFKYRYSAPTYQNRTVDTDFLLYESLSRKTSLEEDIPTNCATLGLKYIASEFDKNFTDLELASLADNPEKTTSLYTLREFVLSLGLYCRAVQIELQTLRNLTFYQAILHLPVKNHFVVLGNMDDTYIRLIDLSKNHFFYRTKLAAFQSEWSAGTALLISDKPVEVTGKFNEIPDLKQRQIFGSDNCDFGCFACTKPIQDYSVLFCPEPIYNCGGRYREYYNRYTCEPGPTGSCEGTGMLRYIESPCVDDPYHPGECMITGIWTSYFMRACD